MLRKMTGEERWVKKVVVTVEDLQAAFWVGGRVGDPGLGGVLGGVREDLKSKTKQMWKLRVNQANFVAMAGERGMGVGWGAQ